MKITDTPDRIAHDSTPAQRIVLAVVTPLVITVCTYGLLTIFDKNVWRNNNWTPRIGINCAPDDLSESWWAWALVLTVIGIIEYRLFARRPSVPKE